MKRLTASLLIILVLSLFMVSTMSAHARRVYAATYNVPDVIFAGGCSGCGSQHQGFVVSNQTVPLSLTGMYELGVANSSTWIDVLHHGPSENVNLKIDHGLQVLTANNGSGMQLQVTTPFVPPLNTKLPYSLEIQTDSQGVTSITGCFSLSCLSLTRSQYPTLASYVPTGGNIIFYGNNDFIGEWCMGVLQYG